MIYESQQAIIDKFKTRDYGALFMEMGTGKTRTICEIYKAKGLNCKIIYICPASLIKQTKQEVAKWGEFDIEFFSSEGISQSDRNYLALLEFLHQFECFLVVDESIKFKNLSSKRTERLVALSKRAKYRFILNGTPITRSILDLLAQMDILDKSILNMKESEFARKFLEYKLENGQKAPWRSWSKPHNEEYLMSLITPYVAELSLDLDIKTRREDVYLGLSTEESIEYQERKQQLLNSPVTLDFLSISQAFQHCYTFASEKLSLIADQPKKTLFFVKFKKWFEILPEILALNGSVGIFNSEQKDELNDFDFGILTYGTGSFGLNLQSFNRIVFVDSTFDYGQKIQAVSRVRRLGQERDIEILNLWVKTGLEEIIEKSLDKKEGSTANIKRILEGMTKEEVEKL